MRGSTKSSRWRQPLVAAVLALALLLSGAIGFGLAPADAVRVRAFADGVRGWQSNPDFRAVQHDYVTLGVAAMRSRFCGVPAERVVMGFRSLPGLPTYLAVNDTSAAHYRAFAAGELSAYLHLAGEQGVSGGVEMIEKLSRRNPLPDADVVAFLDAFKLPVKIPTDAGAIASVRRLIADVAPSGARFEIRQDLVDKLQPIADAIAPTTPDALAVLDARVRLQDEELWRTKQVSDFLAGIWSVGYGKIYLEGIGWLFTIERAARVVLIVLLALVIGALVRRAKSAGSARGALQSSAVASVGSEARA
jgi:hypothetical protein